MTDYVLQITLESPLISASGQESVGVVDRDVVFDNCGLPVLPGRRLKGLWRDAYQDVFDAYTQCKKTVIPVDDIFGESGEVHGDDGTGLHIANAELQEASFLKPWLAYLQQPEKQTTKQKLYHEEVVRHFSTVRAQTAIDRRTGAAREDTLRLSRTLTPGLVFQARVLFAKSPDRDLLNALGLGAAAIQHMGTARTRGHGKVCCRFLHDCTAHTLTHVSLPTIATTSQVPSSSIPVTGTSVLRYRLTLVEPAVIPVVEGDPNTVVTRCDVPGSNLWGAAASHYLRPQNHTANDSEFKHAFLDGGLRFLTAYPEGCLLEEGEEPERLIPIPHSIRELKDEERLVNLPLPENLKNEQTKRHVCRYARMRYGRLETQVVKTERNYHHRRTDDRRYGRGLANDGDLFTYEAIQANQSFQGAVLGSAQDLNKLKNWLKGIHTIYIGRSRSAQYGEAKFEWLDDVPKELARRAEWDGFVESQPHDVWEESPEGNPETGWNEDEGWEVDGTQWTENTPHPDNRMVITTLSPMFAVNDSGHPQACFPKRELAEVLKLDVSALNLSRSYTRTELISGYYSHLRLPRQQLSAIAAGSVFEFELPEDGSYYDEGIIKLEHDGLGLRKSEGMGRIAVNRLELTNKQKKQFDDSESPRPETPNVHIHKVLLTILKRRCLTKMQNYGISASDPNKVENSPSNALLGRLHKLIQKTPNIALDHLSNLRDPAKKQLMDCRIHTSELSTLWLSEDPTLTLHGLLTMVWMDPESFSRELIACHVKALVGNQYPAMRDALITELENNISEEMSRVFLNYFLTGLYRKRRT